MATCEYADDAYLIQAWPQVVVTTPGSWVVTIVASAAGDYTVTIGGVPYATTAAGGETLTAIRDALLLALSSALSFTASPVGSEAAPGIAIAEVVATGATLTASGPSGPAPSEVTVTTIAEGDNATQRAFWLERAKCGVPCCAFFCGCVADYTLWHASLAAHWILTQGAMGPGGRGINDFKRMELGPAMLEASARQYATPTETDLGQTVPGQMVIALRRRYLPPVFCA